jgi:hypothetical protein
MKHFEYYPILKRRFENVGFFPEFLNQYFLLTAFLSRRYHQSLPQLFNELFELSLTKRVIALGKYNSEKVAKDFVKMTSCDSDLLQEIELLKPESCFILVIVLLHFQKAFDNGYKKEALISLLKLLAHIERRFDEPIMSVPLFRIRQQQVVLPDTQLLQKMGNRMAELLKRPYFTRKKIRGYDSGYEENLNSFCFFLNNLRDSAGVILDSEVTSMIKMHYQQYYDTWELIAGIKNAVLKGEPI